MKSVLPAEEFLNPLPLGAVALLALNDHVLKGWGPGWFTGKLSDFAGVFFFPLLCSALARCLGSVLLRRRLGLTPALLASTMGLTAALMLLLELSPEFVRWFEATSPGLDPLGVVRRVRSTMDPTDLFSLPVLWLTWLHGRRFMVPGLDPRSPVGVGELDLRAQKPPMDT